MSSFFEKDSECEIAMSYVIARPRELLALVGSRQVEAVVIACMTAITNRTAVT